LFGYAREDQKVKKRIFLSFLLLVVVFFILKSTVVAENGKFWINVDPSITGPFSVDVKIETNIKEPVTLSLSLALSGQKSNDTFVGTDFKRVQIIDGKGDATIDGTKKVYPYGSKLPPGNYKVEVNFYPKWPENIAAATKLGIKEAIKVGPEIQLGLNQDDTDNMVANSYIVVSTSDNKIKAITKNLSDYSNTELNTLPVNYRKEYRIVVPSDISKEKLKAVMKQLVVQETEKNLDIDEIVIFAYDRKEDSDGIYTFGKMEWCPNGNWGDVTPEIASTNNRSSYQYIYDIKDKVGNIQKDVVPTKKELEIYDSFEALLEGNPYIDEDILKERFAKNKDLSIDEIDRICIKVLTYKMQ